MKNTVRFAPCVLSDVTDTDAEGRWKNSDRVRWRNRFPEKIGGWQKLILSDESDAEIRGICRRLHGWTDLDGQEWVGLGTHKRLYVYSNGVITNITPVRATSAGLTDPITTDDTGGLDPTGGSDASYVSIQDSTHNASEGDIVTISGASAVGGITIDGDYEIRDITDADNYIIKHSSPATSAATGGGSVTVVYELAAGDEAAGVGTGYGLGTWNAGAFGTPRSGSSQITQPRIWSIENWGEDMIGSPLNGAIYVWDKSGGLGNPATLISQAPQRCNRVMVSPEDRHMIAFGCSDPGGTSNYDPLLVRWSDQEDYTDWTPTDINTAGSRRLDGGSYIVTALRTNYGILIFTDSTLHIMQFIGPPGTFSIRQVAENISIMGPNAVIDLNGIPYWMGKGAFWVFDGVARQITCDVWNKVFEDIQEIQGYQVYASLNEKFGELRWDHPSNESEQNARYVVFNHLEGGWYRGTMARSAMHDEASLFASLPFGVDCGGVGISDDNKSTVYIHEQGSDDGDNAMGDFLESYDIHLPGASGEIHLAAMFPDFKVLEGTVKISFTAKKRPQSSSSKLKAFTGISATRERIGIRIRGVQHSMKVESESTGSHWRMGHHEFDYIPDGEAK